MIKKLKIGIFKLLLFILNWCLRIKVNNTLYNIIQSKQKNLRERMNSLKKTTNKNSKDIKDDIYPLF